MAELPSFKLYMYLLTLFHSKRPKLNGVLVVLSALGIKFKSVLEWEALQTKFSSNEETVRDFDLCL